MSRNDHCSVNVSTHLPINHQLRPEVGMKLQRLTGQLGVRSQSYLKKLSIGTSMPMRARIYSWYTRNSIRLNHIVELSISALERRKMKSVHVHTFICVCRISLFLFSPHLHYDCAFNCQYCITEKNLSARVDRYNFYK